ncbi:uncharacterized protein LOC125723807 [Brienomyrus brachyistius]|uniref:uncharacterized protein LOC125720892 n=1 Tax=Brienomyrus brachyistius TaxID=42636 RepID=UPI0020B37920|nr:uncharacterized protein LOC125720892 [Brienomyrus brachyistius]XP_048856560.1 uncharacterized protein LOC125723807 [Brienomyrus brachyistius]
MLSLVVMDKELPFLVDTGATHSTLNMVPKDDQVSTSTVTVVGFSGEELPVTKPVKVLIGKQTFLHSVSDLAYSPSQPVGERRLGEQGASILYSADGLVVTLPEGTRLQCGTQYQGRGQWLMQPVRPRAADIYWGLLEPGYAGILGAYSMWRPWISLLEPYNFSRQVQEGQSPAGTGKPHMAEWVFLRVIKRKWSEPRWTGPFQVTERTSYAVQLKGKGDTWFHWSQCAVMQEPGRSVAEIQEELAGRAQSSYSEEPERTQVSKKGQNNPLT